MLLENRNALVYGAGGKIGAAVARAFAWEGANVFLAGRTLAPLEAVAAEITAFPEEPSKRPRSTRSSRRPSRDTRAMWPARRGASTSLQRDLARRRPGHTASRCRSRTSAVQSGSARRPIS